MHINVKILYQIGTIRIWQHIKTVKLHDSVEIILEIQRLVLGNVLISFITFTDLRKT